MVFGNVCWQRLRPHRFTSNPGERLLIRGVTFARNLCVEGLEILVGVSLVTGTGNVCESVIFFYRQSRRKFLAAVCRIVCLEALLIKVTGNAYWAASFHFYQLKDASLEVMCHNVFLDLTY